MLHTDDVGNMSFQVTVAPTVEPVSLVEAKKHLRVEITDDDDLINALIKAAREHCEMFTKRAFITQTIVMKMDCFPSGRQFLLPRPKAISITSIQYIDEDGATQTFSSGSYTLDSSSEPARVALLPDEEWPDTQDDRINAVTVTFTAGYGATAASVPSRAKQAILLLIGHWYENREQVVMGAIPTELPFAVRALLAGLEVGILS